jgi:hypothetical protein
MKMHDTDPNFTKLLNVVHHIDKSRVQAGYIESKNSKRLDGEDNVSIAVKLQFVGVGQARKRWPFMPQAFDKNIDKYVHAVSKGIGSAVEGLNVDRFTTSINAIGVKMKADIQEEITTMRTPSLAPETIRRKKSSKPLIDTGQLRAAVTYQVEKKK